MEVRKSSVTVEGETVVLESTGDPRLFQILYECRTGTSVHHEVSAMLIPGRGCIVHTSKRIGANMSEASVFVPNVEITEYEGPDEDGNIVTHRRLRGV